MVDAVRTGPQFQVNNQAIDIGLNSDVPSSVTSLANGDFVVSWQVFSGVAGNSEVFAHQYNSAGTSLTAPFLVNSFAVGAQQRPDVTGLAGGGYVVVWDSVNIAGPDQDGSNSGVFGQVYSAAGLEAGSEFQVNTTTSNAQQEPSIAALSAGGFVVTWASFSQDGSGGGIYGQRYDAGGSTVGSEFLINTTTANDQVSSSVTGLSGGGFVVTWQSFGQDGSPLSEGVYGQRFDSSGNATGGEFQINSNTGGDQKTPEITGLDGGGFVATWVSDGQDSSGTGVYGQVYNAAGGTVGSEFLVNTFVTNDQQLPSIAALSDGGFIVVWQSDGQDGSDNGVYGQRFTATGVAAGAEFLVNQTTFNHQEVPSVTGLESGGFIVTWANQDFGENNVFGQMYSYASADFTIGSNNVSLFGPGQTVNALAGNDTVTGADYAGGSDVIFGGAGKDFLSGLAGDDVLDGGDNQDVLLGGDGNDFIDGGGDNDIIDGGADNDTASYASTTSGVDVSLLLQGSAQNTIGAGLDTLSNIENLTGSDFGDRLIGDASDNILDGGDGDDDLRAGAGTDTASYSTASAGVTVSLALQTAFQNTVSAGQDLLNDFENLSGSEFDDTLTGDNSDNGLSGGGGDDVINGGGGNDNIQGNAGNDTLNGGADADIIAGGDGDDTLNGGSGDDVINGDDGDDVITGGSGNDQLNGGILGDDTVSFSTAFAGVNVNLVTSSATGAGNDVLFNFDRIIGSAHDDILVGNLRDNDVSTPVANRIFGGDGNDMITGTSLTNIGTFIMDDYLQGDNGDDILIGGAGNDELYGDDPLLLTMGDDQLFGGLDNDDLFGGLGADFLDGGQGTDVLDGGAGDDVLEGGDGDDAIGGDIGNDTAAYRTASSAVTVDLTLQGVSQNTIGAGNDIILAVENLLGSDFADTLTGDSGDNIIEGGDGDDLLDGGAGTDTVSYASATGGVDISLFASVQLSGSGVGADTISNFENLTGSVFGDTLTGNNNDNVIFAGAGDDLIRGGDGGDDIDGGLGNDTALYLFSSGAVTINFTLDIAFGGQADGDTLAGIENIIGSDHNDHLTGDNNANRFDAGEGINSLDGGGGNDVFSAGSSNDNIDGGTGIDTFTYENASAAVTQYLLFTGLDTGGAGTDTLTSIENLTGSDFDDRLAGDGNDNVLIGGDGVDILKGKGGNDTFFGGVGNDKMTGGVGNDTMFGGIGDDTLIALGGVDTLNGGEDNDFLYGGQDNDTLNGDGGTDNIRGNLGADILNGGTGSDTLRGGGQNDTLNGDADNDFLFGENHSDTLFGGAGDDSLTGGLGGGVFDGFTDTFVYKDTADGGGGFDRIKDFENGIDVMNLQSFGFASFAAVQAIASNSGGGLRIDFGGGDVLFVENFQLGSGPIKSLRG